MVSRRGIVWVALVLYVVLVTLLSTLNLSDSLPKVELAYFDKFVHFCFYFGMNFLLLVLFKTYDNGNNYFTSTFVSIFYGFMIEFVQHFVGRDFDCLDIIANSVGALTGLLVFRNKFINRQLEKFI